MSDDPKLRLVKGAGAIELIEIAYPELDAYAAQITTPAQWQTLLAANEDVRAELERVIGPRLAWRRQPRCGNSQCASGMAPCWQPVLLLKLSWDSAPDRLTVLRPVCPECRELVTLEDILTDEAWVRVLTAFAQSGRWSPRRDLTTLTWDAVN